MSTQFLRLAIPAALIGLLPTTPAAADVFPFFFSAGNPDENCDTVAHREPR